jgi:catechol 2,3-dioxygenase-like lactoylglutathione lyase family enzyme
MNARYVHTNLVARDWRVLAAFYTAAFGCRFVPPERDYRGPTLDAGLGLTGAHLTGAHLLLPGHGDAGPTLEIYHYDELRGMARPSVNQPGYGHLAFEVDDVPAARAEVLALGGSTVGEIVTLVTKTGAKVTMCYVRDPEGNILELQAWS